MIMQKKLERRRKRREEQKVPEQPPGGLENREVPPPPSEPTPMEKTPSPTSPNGMSPGHSPRPVGMHNAKYSPGKNSPIGKPPQEGPGKREDNRINPAAQKSMFAGNVVV